MFRRQATGAAVAVCLAAAVDAFIQTPSVLLRSSFSNTQRHSLFAASQRRSSFRDVRMVYTPAHSSAGLTLEELKERLDRQIAIPSPPSRESPKVGVQRSPCTSLYGNWRPTTGTEPWRSATLHTKPTTKPKSATKDAEAVKEKRTTRGRPPVDPKPAVKEELLADFVQRAAAVLNTNKGRMDSNLFGQHWKILHPDAPIYEYKSNKAVTIHQMLRESGDFFTVSETERQKVKMFELNEEALEKALHEWKQSGKVVSAPASSTADEDVGELIAEGDSPVAVATESQLPQPVKDDTDALFAFEQTEQPLLRGKNAGMPGRAMRMPEADDARYSEVPVHGKARMSSTDRRLRPRTASAAKLVPALAEDDLPAAPVATPLDALRGPVTSLYNSWALDGRDFVMEVAHAGAFDEMYALVAAEREAKGAEFTAIDAGCGNGWAARRLASHPLCTRAIGVDGAALMIKKAQSTDKDGVAQYEIGDAQTWKPDRPADVVMAQELLYVVDDPQRTLSHLVHNCLAPGGRFVAALDCFKENKASHSWAEDMGVPMHCLSEAAWKRMLKEAGLSSIETWRTKASGPWQGTLIVTGVRT